MLTSESLLSLYPLFVKKIGLSLIHQVWTRLLAYVAISSIFVDWTFIRSSFFSTDAFILAIINLSHIFFSYEGFRNLDSGVSFAIFNTYPLMILLIAGVLWNNVYLLVIAGLALFVLGEAGDQKAGDQKAGDQKAGDQKAGDQKVNDQKAGDQKVNDQKVNDQKVNDQKASDSKTNPNFIYGIVMVLFAALTEALIYFMVRRIKTGNHWNHVFLSYMVGLIAITAYMVYSNNDFGKNVVPRMSLAVGLNGFIGAVAYFLRFFAASNLEASIFAPLAYFGMVMSYVYGIVFNRETLSWEKVGGTLCILAANYWAPK
jgi:drug/metabolite transporter (DMT)-like permease